MLHAIAGASGYASAVLPPAALDTGKALAGVTFSNSDKTAQMAEFNGVNDEGVITISEYAKNSGKWYFESYLNSRDAGSYNTLYAGIVESGMDPTLWNADWPRSTTYWAMGLDYYSARVYTGGTWVDDYGSLPGVGGYVMHCVDLDNDLMYHGVNGSWYGSENPVAGTGGNSISARPSSVLPFMVCYNAVTAVTLTATLRFTAADQAYSAPSGYTPWGE